MTTNHFPMRDEMDDGVEKGTFTSGAKLDQHHTAYRPIHPSIHCQPKSIRELLTVTGNDFNFDLLPGVI